MNNTRNCNQITARLDCSGRVWGSVPSRSMVTFILSLATKLFIVGILIDVAKSFIYYHIALLHLGI